jgi:hypothetical protein
MTDNDELLEELDIAERIHQGNTGLPGKYGDAVRAIQDLHKSAEADLAAARAVIAEAKSEAWDEGAMAGGAFVAHKWPLVNPYRTTRQGLQPARVQWVPAVRPSTGSMFSIPPNLKEIA